MTTFFPLELAWQQRSQERIVLRRAAAKPLAFPACVRSTASRFFQEQRRRVLAIAPDVEVEDSLGTGHSAAIVLFPPGSPSAIVSTVMLLGKLLECLDHIGSPHVSSELPLNQRMKSCAWNSMGLESSDCASPHVPDAAQQPEQAARTRPPNQAKMLAKKDKDPVFDQFPYEIDGQFDEPLLT